MSLVLSKKSTVLKNVEKIWEVYKIPALSVDINDVDAERQSVNTKAFLDRFKNKVEKTNTSDDKREVDPILLSDLIVSATCFS